MIYIIAVLFRVFIFAYMGFVGTYFLLSCCALVASRTSKEKKFWKREVKMVLIKPIVVIGEFTKGVRR